MPNVAICWRSWRIATEVGSGERHSLELSVEVGLLLEHVVDDARDLLGGDRPGDEAVLLARLLLLEGFDLGVVAPWRC
jgi:hypothetical protein